MPLDYDRISNWSFPDVIQTYTARDTMLYALGVGYGFDPVDEAQLRFVYGKDLVAAPTMSVVLGYPGLWVRDPAAGLDWVRILHGELAIRMHRPLPPSGTVIGRNRVKAVIDKGRDKGALIIVERTLYDQASGALLATVDHTSFCRGNGGFGKGDAPPPPLPAVPGGEPDAHCDLPTLPQSALIYRLSADPNPLHAEPAVARAGGFSRPILHGLCTCGVACHAILKTCCDYQPERLTSLAMRVSSPVYPGDTIRTAMWRRGETIQFRARALERDAVVLTNGVATIKP